MDRIKFLKDIKDSLEPVFKKYGVLEAMVFGDIDKVEEEHCINLMVDSGLKGMHFSVLEAELADNLQNVVQKYNLPVNEIHIIDVSHYEEGSLIAQEIQKTGSSVCSVRKKVADRNVIKMVLLIEKIQAYCDNISYKEFISARKLLDACAYNLMQLGELTFMVDQQVIQDYPHIPWKQVSVLKNGVTHKYDGVNYKLMWEIIQEQLDEIKEDFIRIIDDDMLEDMRMYRFL